MGCGRTLILVDSVVRCSYALCSQPSAVAQLLDDEETAHVVVLAAGGFTVRHPLRERLEDRLMACQLHEYIAALPSAPRPVGRYRVHAMLKGWTWEVVE